MIELNGRKMCPSCFAEITFDGECFCNFSDRENNENVLKKGVILNGRYIIGKLIEDTHAYNKYLSYDSLENRKVFIKEFFPKYFHLTRTGNAVNLSDDYSLDDYNRTMQETINRVKLAQKLSCNYSLKVQNAFFENNTAYFVVDCHPVCSVSEYIKDNFCISCEEAVGYLHQLLTFLNEVNEAGFMHGEINSDTVYIDAESEKIFVDGFDCNDNVAVASASTIAFHYNSYSHIKRYTKLQSIICDGYSVGAVLYTLLTRKKPEGSELPDDNFDMFAMEKIADKDLLQFIKNLCCLNHFEYGTFYDVIRDANRIFKKYRLPEIKVTEMVTTQPEIKNNVKNKKWIIAVISIIILAIIAGATALSLRYNNTEPTDESTTISDVTETEEIEDNSEDNAEDVEVSTSESEEKETTEAKEKNQKKSEK